MTRRRSTVSQNDLSRVVRATAKIVGLDRIARVRVLPSGEIHVDVGEPGIGAVSTTASPDRSNEWDRVLGQ